jgi:uncharacterized membrane protein YgaE (UPF0421/DUF939 family)
VAEEGLRLPGHRSLQNEAGRLAGVALSIIVLARMGESPAQASIARFLEVGLGIIVALAVSLLVFPPPRPAKAEIRAPA